MSSELVALAEKFVRLSSELDETRDAMKRLLLNGGDHAPRPLSAQPARAPGRAHLTSSATEAAERKIVEALTATPGLLTSAVAAATGSPVTSTVHRLRRLRSKGMVQGGGHGGWQVAAPA